MSKDSKRDKLCEVLCNGVVNWVDYRLPDSDCLKTGSGVAEAFQHDDGLITFSCGGYTHIISVEDEISENDGCFKIERTAPNGSRWLLSVWSVHDGGP